MSENEGKIEFLSSMSHEVRTLLNTIVGLSEDIDGYEDIPEEIREDAEDIHAEAQEKQQIEIFGPEDLEDIDPEIAEELKLKDEE